MLNEPATATPLVLRGGRVIDPASGTDEIADVVMSGGRITAVGPGAGDDVVAAPASVGLPRATPTSSTAAGWSSRPG